MPQYKYVYFQSVLQPLQVVADVSSTKDMDRLVAETVAKFGKLDVLVTRVGHIGLSGIKHSNFMQVYDRMTKVMLRPVVYLTHIAVPHLIKTNGSIVHLSSFLAENPVSFKTEISTCMPSSLHLLSRENINLRVAHLTL